ncbi:hypothetical protein Esi_0020_0124 [Ectocarpus siliculosus]|uniref:Stc1 domain-containing protein n=1 Tax=Ectocarpus siliculosus TaxID=2880 RepID=D8LHX8_ECTSI|nr:hypothetical protein Esi_0020_0124 [Ectocarpus siliculosus]|eukprot:CBN74409.1 hypothetical protein Esi_0020_0124 [Ectocarpus siliculosus]
MQGASASGAITCTVCGVRKPASEYSRNQLARSSREVCQVCLMSDGTVAAPPSRVAPAAGEGVVRCVACCQVKTTSSFGINQLRRRAGIERCMLCVEKDLGSVVLCRACNTHKPFTDFSKKQLACKPGSERCKVCIENASR